jgi:alpha-amylase
MIFLTCIFGLCSEVQAEELSPHFLYFILVDRFHNGDQGNDQSIDLSDPQAFHGGDLNGIEAKLTYLEDLGVDFI